MRLQSLLMQLLIGMSIRRYLPPIGTAGLERSMVRGYSRVPRPPPRIRLKTSRCMVEVSCSRFGRLGNTDMVTKPTQPGKRKSPRFFQEGGKMRKITTGLACAVLGALLCGCGESQESKRNRATSEVNVLADKLSEKIGADGWFER